MPILRELIPAGISYGTSLVVEFTPDSLWYESSLAIVAYALKEGVKADYHTFQRSPDRISEALARHELDVRKLQQEDKTRIIDSYTVQTGLGTPENPEDYVRQSVRLSDWSIPIMKEIKGGIPEEQKGRLNVDDNTGVLLRYNEEKVFIDFFRTRLIPYVRAREMVLLNSFVSGVASFYRQFESLCDGIIDFKSVEKEDQLKHYVRVRAMRERACDSRWRRLSLENGEVNVAD